MEISFKALPVKVLPVKTRNSVLNMGRKEKIMRTIKKGMTVDKLPMTGMIVGLALPIPLASPVLMTAGFIAKYSIKAYKYFHKNTEKRLNKLV